MSAEMVTKTSIAAPGPWAREYACGCREVLDEGEATGRDDTCPRHGEHVRVVGFLTPESVAEALLESCQRMLGIVEYKGSLLRSASEDATDVIAKATGGGS